MTKPLDDRIADAFETKMTSAELKVLLDETNAADEAAKAESAAASKIAMDPAVRPAKVAEARKRMEDADFRSRRMSTAANKLAKLHLEAKSQEDAAERAKIRAAALAERDQVAEALKEYEELAGRITALMHRLVASNAKVGEFETAEVIARGFEERWLVRPDETRPRLIHTLRLPKFRPDGTNYGYRWPPPRR